MKIIITLIAAAFPAAVSAQMVTPTLDMVQDLSVSAASSQSLGQARTDAGKPFTAHVPAPVGHQQPGQGHNNPGNHDNPGHHNGGPQVNPPYPVHPPQPVHPVHPGHPGQPPQTHPVNPPNPYHPYNPGWNPNPYHPGPYNPGYYPPSGPSHQTTSPVVHHPVSTSTWAIVGAVLLTVLLVVILL